MEDQPYDVVIVGGGAAGLSAAFRAAALDRAGSDDGGCAIHVPWARGSARARSAERSSSVSSQPWCRSGPAAEVRPDEWVLHVDLDHFLSAVEVRRRPELAGRPVVVGGDGNPGRPRQVVATASYEARAFGVHSGMPLGEARRRCPDAVFLPTDRAAYDEASEEVMAVLRSFGVPVEVLGWDEAYLGVNTDDPEAFADGIRAASLGETGLPCAVGIGQTRGCRPRPPPASPSPEASPA